MALLKNDDELRRVRASGARLAAVLGLVMAEARPGRSTAELDLLAERLIRERDALPVFKGYAGGNHRPFPASICTSLNEEVVHGIPRKDRVLRDGDVLKIDIGLRFEGLVTDMARTLAIGAVTTEAQKLIRVTKESLRRGIAALKPGRPLVEYSRAVQNYVEENGFSVIRDLVGHGVGHELHESPHIPNYVTKQTILVVRPGMVLALEPMVNAGSYAVRLAPDDWTIVTEDGRLGAHFEDTVVITEGGAEVVTQM
jgi:methionyl aminopeptidase